MACRCYILTIPLFNNGHLGCFHLFVIMNNTAMNIGAWIPVLVLACSSFRCIPGGGVAGPYCSSVLNYLRNHQNVFHSGYTI